MMTSTLTVRNQFFVKNTVVQMMQVGDSRADQMVHEKNISAQSASSDLDLEDAINFLQLPVASLKWSLPLPLHDLGG